MRRHQRSLAKVLGVLAAVALVAFVMPTSANHPQTDSGKSIVFDEKPGNQWWVEVAIAGADASKVTKVEAQIGAPSGSAWKNLPKQNWGAYAASFEAGIDSDIRFRATFTDGTQAVSCWSKHPAGTEQCTWPSPPGNWRSSAVGDVGRGFGNEATVADYDQDGIGELIVAADDAVFTFDRTATGYQRRTIIEQTPFEFNMDTQDFELVTVGSTDRDVVPEVYTVGRYYDGQMTRDRLMWHHYNGEVWSSDVVWDFRDVSDILIGNIDDDESDELIVVTDDGRRAIVYIVEREPGQFFFTEIARFANEDWSMGRAAVADADRDLDQELFIAYGTYPDFQAGILRVDSHDGVYVQDSIWQADIAGEVRGLAAGDGDNDGLAELYLLDSGFFPDETTTLHRFSPRTDGWSHVLIPMGKGFQSGLELGDGNGDGFQELYAGSQEGQLTQAMWTGSAWMTRSVFQFGSGDSIRDVTLGDTDGDGKSEAYGIHLDGSSHTCCPAVPPLVHVSRMAPVASGTSTTTTTSSTTTTGGFDATFTGVRGNEWWEQASVPATGGTLSKVDVRLNNGAWQTMTKQSYGYTASIRAVQGTIVQFRATSTAGATDLSDCYRWIPAANTDATKVACGGTTTTTTTTTTSSTTTTGTFDATFTGVKGNDWWVQANVASTGGSLAGVDARVNCSGTWKPLALQNWGGWAASFNIPAGSKVDFRARSTAGATDLSGGYVWPNATPTTAC